MSASPDDNIKELIERAQAGDSAAYSSLYNLHVDKIYRYVSYRVPDGEVEDITSDVFLKMIEGLPNFTYTGAPFEAWLYQIARARVADFHRRRNRNQHEEISDTLSDERPLPEERLLTQQEIGKIRTMLQELSEEEQTILLLRFVEHKSHKEVAEIIGKSVAAARTMQHRALVKLADLMDVESKERHYLRGKKQPEPEEE